MESSVKTEVAYRIRLKEYFAFGMVYEIGTNPLYMLGFTRSKQKSKIYLLYPGDCISRVFKFLLLFRGAALTSVSRPRLFDFHSL